MEVYILKSAAILAILFAFYKLVLENTSIHTFKRIYLFGSLLASFLIPFITFTSYVEVSPVVYTYTQGNPQTAIPETIESINYWPFVLWAIYGLGVLFFGVKFFRNLFIIIQQIKTNPKYRNSGFINILLSENVIPHTFFNYIFLNKQKFERGEIPSEVILHEQTHAIQKHTLDVIFVEILQIVFWFNPLLFFIKISIKLNHEFLADAAVLNSGTETSQYQNILLAFSSNATTPSLAHSINYSSIKKRFTVMKTHTSKRAILLRSLLILPMVCVLIYGFSTRAVVEKEVSIQKMESVFIQQKDTIKLNGELILQKDTIKLNGEIIQQKAPEAEIAKYNKLGVPLIKTEDKKDSTVIYYKNKVITLEEAEELVKQNKVLSVNIIKSAEGINKVIITERPNTDVKSSQSQKNANNQKISANNRNLYMVPEAPPAPNPNKTEYIKELAKRGATFYIGPNKYTTDEALKMVEKSTKEVTIDVSKYPMVFLGGC